jgi:hypothetical protein
MNFSSVVKSTTTYVCSIWTFVVQLRLRCVSEDTQTLDWGGVNGGMWAPLSGVGLRCWTVNSNEDWWDFCTDLKSWSLYRISVLDF